MSKAKLSLTAISTLVASRGLTNHKELIKSVFAEAKRHYNIPPSHRLRVECDDVVNSNFGVLIRKKNNKSYDVLDHLVPKYPYFYSFVESDEAVALLTDAANEYGVPDTVGVAAPSWNGIKCWNNTLFIPCKGGVRSLPMEDAVALLTLAGVPTSCGTAPVGAGGILAVPKGLLVAV